MKRLLSLFLLSVSIPLVAAEPTAQQRRMELARQYLVAIDMPHRIDLLIDRYLLSYEREVLSDRELVELNDSKSAGGNEARAFFEHCRQLVRERLDVKKTIENVFVPLYAKSYSEDELREMVAFFTSTVGKKVIHQQDALEETAMRDQQASIPALVESAIGQAKQEHEKTNPWKSTMADLRTLATATEAYATDTNRYPDVRSLEELKALLQPIYLSRMSEKDGWGNAFLYLGSPDGQHYRFASAGSDGRFEASTERIEDLDPQTPPRVGDSSASDIVYQDGIFVQIPREAVEPRQHD